jgi:uncharacterized protein YaaQ
VSEALTLRALWGGPGGGTYALLDRLPRRPDARVWAYHPADRGRRRVGADSLKLLLIIASSHDGDRLIDTLVSRGLPATKIASRGGFLRRGSVTILSGVDDDNVDIVMELTRRECQMRKELVPTQGLPVFGEVSIGAAPIEVQVGGATVFVMDVARFEHF